MKKYLLSLSIIGLSFIGISYGYTFECEFNNSFGTNCTPATISYEDLNNGTNTVNGNLNAEYKFYYDNIDDSSYKIRFECTNNICTYRLNFEPDDLIEYDFNFINATCVEPGNLGIPSNEFCNATNEGGDTPGGDTPGGEGGGNEGGNGSDLGLISHLTPAINGLWDTVVELIPYIVYIGIGECISGAVFCMFSFSIIIFIQSILIIIGFILCSSLKVKKS